MRLVVLSLAGTVLFEALWKSDSHVTDHGMHHFRLLHLGFV